MAIKVDERCFYSKDHEWVRVDGDYAVCGISDYAQDQLGDVVYLELPEVGDSFSKGETFGVVESVKAASDVYMPVAGEISEVNAELADSPELVNQDPYGEGWLIRLAVEDPEELNALMTAEKYRAYLDTLAEGGSHR